MKKLLILIFLFILPGTLKGEVKSFDYFYSIEKDILKNSKNIIIFSSRAYLEYFLLNNFEKDKNIYWIVPAENIEEKEFQKLKEYYTYLGFKVEYNYKISTPELKINDYSFFVIPRTEILKISEDKAVIIVDNEYFFRLYPKEFPNKRGENVINFYKSLYDLELDIEKLIIVRSKDINLPMWNDEVEYLLANAFEYYNKKVVPYHLITLDDTDNSIAFAEWEIAIYALVEIEKKMKNNPFLYKRIMFVGVKLREIGYTLKAFELLYSLNPSMAIDEGLALLDFLKEKYRFYEAYGLIKYMYKKEPWNLRLKDIFYDITEIGYFYYSEIEKNDELKDVFEQELREIGSQK